MYDTQIHVAGIDSIYKNNTNPFFQRQNFYKFPNDRESTTQLYLIYQQFGNLKCASIKNNRTKFVRTWPTTSLVC